MCLSTARALRLAPRWGVTRKSASRRRRPAAQQVVEGKLRGLAVTSKERSGALPDVPTTAEAGYPTITGDNWQGIVVPARTPKEVVAFLHRELSAIMKLPAVREQLAALGFEPVAGTPEEFGRHARAEFEKWAKVIKDSNIKPQ
jgi:tripartite-type tricarboxylate transporter receptor subunit TctC